MVIVTWSVESRASSVYSYSYLIDLTRAPQWICCSRLVWNKLNLRIQPSVGLYALKTLNVGDDEKEKLLFFIERQNIH